MAIGTRPRSKGASTALMALLIAALVIAARFVANQATPTAVTVSPESGASVIRTASPSAPSVVTPTAASVSPASQTPVVSATPTPSVTPTASVAPAASTTTKARSSSTLAAAAGVSSPAGDYVTVVGSAQVTYRATKGQVSYCPLDDLGRATCAYGSLTSSLRATAKSEGREDINVDPAGWPAHNVQVTIPKLATGVSGSKDYRGWLWNRSHLVADSLGGEAIKANLVTGTRTQNVGSAQTKGEYSGGMAYTERIARDYLDTGRGDGCPLYYAATPHYVGSYEIPDTVTVDMKSCDGTINTRVVVSNTANGWNIDYATGTATKSSR